LLTLRFGVRKDQPGTVIRDFHTAHTLDGKKSMPLSNRYYLSDAVFLAGIGGERSMLETLDRAVRYPAFPLYLGRRSCPPALPVSLGLREAPLLEALKEEPWLASERFQRRNGWDFHAEILIDKEAVRDGEHSDDVRGSRDVPLSFDPRHREYSFRDIERHRICLGGMRGVDHHDPMAELED